ncbi:MAG: ATP-binding protein [Archangium sp.]
MSFFDDILRLPEQVVVFEAQRRLEAMHPSCFVLHSRSNLFRHTQFVHEGQATLVTRVEHGAVVEDWPNDDCTNVTRDLVHRWDTVKWNEREFECITLTTRSASNTEELYFVVGESEASVRKFFLAVCDWCATTRGAVLVFSDGHFSRSTTLQQTIERASLDDLILPEELRVQLREDLHRFVHGRATYEKHKVAWKRGLLLIGPPGNGKTHTLRALIAETKWPVLYVKSFRGRHSDAEEGIAQVFARARRAAPCVVVLEDLDCLIDEGNRSVLLNELDGFAENEGILVLASTNHPEKLDRSLLDRPSRFDRKLHFGLPAAAERRRYLEKWQRSVEPALKLTEAALVQLVEGTHGFTFAYLKELTMGAMLSFMERPGHVSMDDVAADVLATLKGEMSSARKLLPPLPEGERRISLS